MTYILYILKELNIQKTTWSCFGLAIAFMNLSCSSEHEQRLSKDNAVRPYVENPRYWQYKEEPILLLGATNNDNIFQSEDVEEQLNSLYAAGGNYVRNTMSFRDSTDVKPFWKDENGIYDLNKWNDEYWQRFEKFLALAEKREIIVQIEVWDRFDFSREPWQSSPFNAINNSNYSLEECGMEENYPKHPFADLQPFFHAIEGMPHYSPKLELVRKYQHLYIDKMLSYSLRFSNVLYCMNNETSTPPEWGIYWINHFKEKAGNKKIYTTDMFDTFYRPRTCKKCLGAIQNPGVYSFLDVSQINSRNFGENHWDTLSIIIGEREKYVLRPVNCVKVYGGGNSNWGSGSNDDGVERFCRDVMGGCAAVRHHRPIGGNGLNDKAVASIKTIRKVESVVRFWEAKQEMSLLADREANEAYMVAIKGEKYVLYFPKTGEVKLDLSNFPVHFEGQWIDLSNGEWGEQFTLVGGGLVKIDSPYETGAFAVIKKSN